MLFLFYTSHKMKKRGKYFFVVKKIEEKEKEKKKKPSFEKGRNNITHNIPLSLLHFKQEMGTITVSTKTFLFESDNVCVCIHEYTYISVYVHGYISILFY